MTKKREPIDDLIDAHVWLAAQRRKKCAFALGALRGVPARRRSAKRRHAAIAARGKAFPHMNLGVVAAQWDHRPESRVHGYPKYRSGESTSRHANGVLRFETALGANVFIAALHLRFPARRMFTFLWGRVVLLPG